MGYTRRKFNVSQRNLRNPSRGWHPAAGPAPEAGLAHVHRASGSRPPAAELARWPRVSRSGGLFSVPFSYRSWLSLGIQHRRESVLMHRRRNCHVLLKSVVGSISCQGFTRNCVRSLSEPFSIAHVTMNVRRY